MPDEFRDKHWANNFFNRTRKWIGYFDVLGFEKFIKKTELLDAAEKFESVLREGKKKALDSSCTTFSIKGQKNPILKNITFSDSILFYIEPHIDITSAFHYMVVSSAILLATFIEKGFFLRGAISYGQLYVDDEKSLFIGQGLIDAIRLEKEQEWAGCIIKSEMPDVWNNLKKSGALNPLIENKDLIKYDIPFKKKEKQKENLYAINWVKYLSSPQEIQVFLKKERENLCNKDPRIEAKIDNTLTFLKKSQSIGT